MIINDIIPLAIHLDEHVPKYPLDAPGAPKRPTLLRKKCDFGSKGLKHVETTSHS